MRTEITVEEAAATQVGVLDPTSTVSTVSRPRDSVTNGPSETAPVAEEGVRRRERLSRQALARRLSRAQSSARRATLLAVVALALTAGAVVLLALGVHRSQTAVERVVAKVSPSTVFVESLWRRQRVESGTGWVLDGRRGLIATNAHVVNGGSTFRVGVAGGFRPARIVGAAPCEDLAVLQVEDRSGLKSLPLGNQSQLRLGQTVVAVGYPGNASGEASLTSTVGIVSVIRSAYREPALDIPRYPNVVQTDAAVNPGNSGGPLVLLNRRLVGVNSAGRTLSPGGRIIQGQSYAIGVERVKEMTSVLRTGRSLGWTGLGFDYPTTPELKAARLPPGVFLTHAVPGTSGSRAGLADKRALLLAVNGRRVGNSLAGYCDAVSDVRSGEAATFTVFVPGAPRAKSVKLVME